MIWAGQGRAGCFVETGLSYSKVAPVGPLPRLGMSNRAIRKVTASHHYFNSSLEKQQS